MAETDIFETTFPVRYAETDQMGVVHHSSYVIWMEEGRSQYMRAKGFAYERLEQQGTFLAVAEMHLRYLAAARYGDAVTVRTWIDELRSRTVTFGYEVLHAVSRALLVTGRVKLVCIDRRGQVSKLPASVRAAIDSQAP